MRYRGDPHWITARYRGSCRKCEQPIGKGSEAFYYPKGKYLYCRPCGEPMSREFEMVAADEDFYNSRY